MSYFEGATKNRKMTTANVIVLLERLRRLGGELGQDIEGVTVTSPVTGQLLLRAVNDWEGKGYSVEHSADMFASNTRFFNS